MKYCRKIVCKKEIKNKNIMSSYKGFRDLIVYQKSYLLALEINEIIKKTFPKEEKYTSYFSSPDANLLNSLMAYNGKLVSQSCLRKSDIEVRIETFGLNFSTYTFKLLA